MVLRSIRTVMAILGIAIAAAAKKRCRRDPVKSTERPGKAPGTNHFRVMPKIQERRIPVKKAGTAMHSWLKTVWAAAAGPPVQRVDRRPKGMDTTVISRKLSRLRHSVTSTLEEISVQTGWR